MVGPDPVMTVAGSIGALAAVCLSVASILHFLENASWRNASLRGLGISLLSLAGLLIFRQSLPDLLVPALVFLSCLAADIVVRPRVSRKRGTVLLSIAISLAAVGALLLVDGILRYAGHRLTLGLWYQV